VNATHLISAVDIESAAGNIINGMPQHVFAAAFQTYSTFAGPNCAISAIADHEIQTSGLTEGGIGWFTESEK